VILNDPLDEGEKLALKELHTALASDYPPLGAELDGYYILLYEARRSSPARHQWLDGVVDNSWALHRAHILAGRCIILSGPDPKQIYPKPTWSELESDLQGELDYVARHLGDYPAYCVLNLCRLMYSFETRDVVVSKAGSSRWADEAFPEWTSLIDAVRKAYQGMAIRDERELLKSEVGDCFDIARRYIEQRRDTN
jgi:hypothetical protein